MSKSYIFLMGLAICLALTNCANSQNKHARMRLTAYKLLSFLKEKDSAGVVQLFDDKKMLFNKQKEISNDCNFISKITKKYGFPSLNKLSTTKAKDGGNIVWVRLLDKPDSSLNLIKCELVVYFYPDEFIVDANKFYNYIIYTELLNPPSQKIIEAPEIKIE